MSDLKILLKQAARPFLFLLTFIMICAFLARYLTGEETLLEYAKNNPELAYGTQNDTDSGKNVPQGNADSRENALQNGVTESVKTPVSETTPLSSAEKRGEKTAPLPQKSPVTADEPSPYTEGKSIPEEEPAAMTSHPDRVTYQEGFYYEPLTDEVKERITGISYPERGCTVPYEDLAYVGLLYIDFAGSAQPGELICNQAVAQDIVEIFYELYRNDYRLERVRLIDEYGGDDTASMADNNTSCFNYRVVDGTTNLSKHAYGLAIDVNPYYNPYVVFHKNPDGSTYISPPGSEIYADRSQTFPYKIDENDLCYRLFTEHGFTWGGNWNSAKDYQHFQKAQD